MHLEERVRELVRMFGGQSKYRREESDGKNERGMAAAIARNVSRRLKTLP